MTTFTETLADHVHHLKRTNRKLQRDLSRIQLSRDEWRAKAERAQLEARQLAERNRVLLIDKANLIARATVGVD